MDPADIRAFEFCAGIGSAFGLMTALVCYRSKSPLLWTLAIAEATATVGGILVIGVMEAVDSVTNHGYSVESAIKAGLGAAFLISFASPFAFGFPGALAGVAFQWILQRLRLAARVN